MAAYREIAPPARFTNAIECFWSLQPFIQDSVHRVTPDGCADILFTRDGETAALEVVGPMTSYRDHPIAEGQSLFGVRFRPGMGRAILGVPGARIADGVLPLSDLWGSRVGELLARLSEASTAEQCAAVFSAVLPMTTAASPVQRAVASIELRRGCVSLDEVARDVGVSTRQFRRLCLEETGLTPKFLARVIRFRHVLSRVGDGGSLADLALDCGYYDQAHCINEFREFSGRTPGGRAGQVGDLPHGAPQAQDYGRFFQSSVTTSGVA
jgi:AraC-like DNA-binding protein